MVETVDLYCCDDDCTTGQCAAEIAFVPQDIDNFDLDQMFAGSDVDSQCGLEIASVDTAMLSDELFPPIFDGAPITLEGVLDVFARRYPQRAQLLDMLINGEGYEVIFVDEPNSRERELREEMRRDSQYLRQLRVHAQYGIPYSSGIGSPTQDFERVAQRYSDNAYLLESLKHWRIADNKILITSRINKNIDKFNWFFGMDDDDLIFENITNDEGADWLNRVMGDWMVRSGIPGANRSEEFTDSWSSRVIWGTLSVVVGAVEIVAGIVTAVGTSWSGVGLLAGGAMTIAGVEALTQGFDMLRTPNQSAHETGWLGDAAFTMAERFGVLETNDRAAFNKYWSFTMLGLSLGGAGVSAMLPATRAALQSVRTSRNLSFLANATDRAVDAARLTLVGIRNATFGRLAVSYAAMPSGRILFNIRGVGRVVAETWESMPRIRLRMSIANRTRLLERARKLQAGEAGIVSLRGAIRNQNQARKLVYDVARRMGLSGPELDRLVSTIRLGAEGTSSSFNFGTRRLRIRPDIGYPTHVRGYWSSQYNELVAINEVAHEIGHAQRFARWMRNGGTVDDFTAKYGRYARDNGARYFREEIRIETAASEVMQSMVRPRIERLRLLGRTDEATEMQRMLDVALEETAEYLALNRRLLRGALGE